MKELSVLKGHKGAVWNCKFSNDGNYCLSAGHDRTIKLWNPHKGNQLFTYQGHSYEVLDVSVSPDSKAFASCGKEKTALLWNTETSAITRRLRGHTHAINSVCFNEQGNVLVSGSYDKSVRLWDLMSNNHQPIQVLEDAKDSVTSVVIAGHEIFTGFALFFFWIYSMFRN
jgi:mitogen-activated protein kinase organizer 1